MGETRQTQAGGLSVQTLVISSLAAVVATVVVSQLWRPGTLLFTALVPVVVAITSELLKHPVKKVTAAAPKVAPIVVPRRTAGGTEVHEPLAPEPLAPEPSPADRPPLERPDPFGLREPERRSLLDDRRVRIGLLTGLVAFVIGAGFVTLSELTFGGSVGGGDRRTTLLGGDERSSSPKDNDRERNPERDEQASPTPTPTPSPSSDAPRATPAPESTPRPDATPTPTATPEPAPSPAPAPGATPQPSPVP